MTPAASAFHALVLAATARAAAGTARKIRDRQAGRDASAQEPEGDVRRDLGRLRGDLAEWVVRLRLQSVAGTPADATAALVHTFETRLLLDDAARTLGEMHQKLLSLYPAVSAGLVEDVRLAAAEASRQRTADRPDARLQALAARLADLQDALGESLGA